MLTVHGSAGPSPQPALDEAVRASRYLPGQWFLVGMAQVLNPVVVTLSLMVLLLVAPVPHTPDALQVYVVGGALVSALVVRISAQCIADLHGGWREAFGWALPRAADLPAVGVWLSLQLASRFALTTVLASAYPTVNAQASGGLSTAPVLSGRGAALLLICVVVIAPAMEELAFRGVVLRGLMRRMSFWPSALASSLLFACLHVTAAGSTAALPSVVLTVMLFAVLQCVLVRRTGRLGPAVIVHSGVNLLFTAAVLTAF
jgi:membrane protease YdiL (CAAX protease family)